ncbi:mannitol dehydrogenase family protein [Anaerotruncus sp. 1XD42-93]|uniref:mannitol dehydrogenase family protein n=1 Tax=Anaerotruncus sp. 1XD42-93 TaxID=2320853 RepID=UPI000EA284D7|nr:mannitol dehydrogenase family protein [Anaerotruncus sp. 1XD42-93]NBK19647.1 mannitol dehydrogenase family protein [Anaerotruncus sp. 1XD42-93]RKJ78572.1 mannitol dehydrogenase family protein [Anaerotruncus sp. 1XD22-93]
MKLCYEGLKDRAAWEAAGVALPQFDWKEMCAATAAEPTWVHFGAGNIFRGFIALLQQSLLEQGLVKGGIVAADTFDYDIIEKIYTPFDHMTLMVSLLPDGSMEKEVVASIAEGLRAGNAFPEDMDALKRIFRNPSLQMASFTITEKGYALKNIQGDFFPFVEADFKNGPSNCSHAMSMVASLLLERFNACAAPVAMVSMDNCSHNGEKLRSSVMTVVEKWLENGFVSQEFVAWVQDETKVSFPWSMIDKITPRPAKVVEESLAAAGIENMAPIVTSKNTFIAPFVNAEQPQYLVVEDRFPNGRPPLEKAGVYMTDRDTVNNTEKMKVTTCLNPLHTALAVYGCLLGYDSIAAEMKDPELKALVERIGYDEGIPVVVDPKILSPMDFIHEVIDQRLPNPFIPDMPQRIATDTSQKVAIRFGETIKSYLARPDLNAADLTYIPLAIAGWLRYLLAVDDKGNPMECSSDPMLETLQQQLSGATLGNPDSLDGKLPAILSNTALFAADLNEAGLGGKIETMLRELMAGPGAVRDTLKKYLRN